LRPGVLERCYVVSLTISAKRFVSRMKCVATLSVFLVSTSIMTLFSPLSVHAATPTGTALSPAARISFTFDDSLQSTYTNAAPTLQQYGLTGTDYAISGCVGMTTVPNTCNANGATPYMSWAQVQALQNSYGWEIGSHTVDHDCLASSAKTDPSDCANPAPLTTAQVDAELANSKSALAANGINATDFAPPYGDYNNNVLAQIAKYYASMRQFKNASNNSNVWPYSDYYLQDQTILQTTDTVADVESMIAKAETGKQWLVLTFHDIEASPSKTPDNYQYGTAELAQIAAYVQAQQNAGLIQSVHVNAGLVTSATNLFANGSFSDGIADGWTTDSPTNITSDTGDNGSYPNPTDSVKLVSTTKNTHLFSPKVSVTPGTTYVMKNFLNVQQVNGGEVGFYVDEYDANGNWISGQWLKAESSEFVEDMNFTYTPTSANVSQASLQVVVTGTPGTTAYLANAQMFPSLVGTIPTDLVPNGTFGAGIGDGWTTDDPTHIQANSGGNGSPADPTDSISLQSGTTSANGHLFSPKVAVSSTNSYSITNWLNLKQINSTSGGEVAFYIDEYNSAGQWISGQYKTGIHTVGAGNVGFSYTPSSASVTQASLQVIVVGNAGIQAYLDNVDWYQN
jgi:peptidoglycan/xylan/chitin deacetylase (PgdA/CDA1 family)